MQNFVPGSTSEPHPGQIFAGVSSVSSVYAGDSAGIADPQ